jgi:hypothetical protein
MNARRLVASIGEIGRVFRMAEAVSGGCVVMLTKRYRRGPSRRPGRASVVSGTLTARGPFWSPLPVLF